MLPHPEIAHNDMMQLSSTWSCDHDRFCFAALLQLPLTLHEVASEAVPPCPSYTLLTMVGYENVPCRLGQSQSGFLSRQSIEAFPSGFAY